MGGWARGCSEQSSLREREHRFGLQVIRAFRPEDRLVAAHHGGVLVLAQAQLVTYKGAALFPVEAHRAVDGLGVELV